MNIDRKSSGSGNPEKSRATASYLSNSSKNSISPELISLVKRTALHLKGRLPSNIDLDDLTQSGLEGLIQAMDAFDPSRNITLEQFAKTRIRGAMLDDVRRMSQTTRTTIAFKKEENDLYCLYPMKNEYNPKIFFVALPMEMSINHFVFPRA